ncbi:hypothetical protein CD241_0204 [Corynebacterium diphtheriae 241]|nr:hypothetical protein CD241_0204 [Corynebacterium diphtheriae 241]
MVAFPVLECIDFVSEDHKSSVAMKRSATTNYSLFDMTIIGSFAQSACPRATS